LTKKEKNEYPATVRRRGCPECPRWDAFVHAIWKEEQELCPIEHCLTFLNKLIPVEKLSRADRERLEELGLYTPKEKGPEDDPEADS